MRKIKFRAWDKKLNRFDDRFPLELRDFGKLGYTIANNDFVFQQYIGLKDRSGREIYEGDVLGEEEEPFAVVVWDEEGARFGLKFPNDHIDKSRMTLIDWFDNWKYRNWRVIGNIYENPELLEVK